MYVDRYPSGPTSVLKPISMSLDLMSPSLTRSPWGLSRTTLNPFRMAIAGISPRFCSRRFDIIHQTRFSSSSISGKSFSQ